MQEAAPFLSVCLTVRYRNKPPVLRNVFLQIRAGEVLSLVGSSGSGKSTIALSIMGLLDRRMAQAEGSVFFRGTDLMKLNERQLRSVRGRDIGLVLQSPLSALNPALRIGTQLKEAWRAHANTTSKRAQAGIVEAMQNVSLPSDQEFLRRFPSQLSVGQAQRVLIAMAILHKPPLLVTDEPTSALDPITAAEILNLFGDLNRRLNVAILYISHDLLSVARICHRIAILHDGEVVECDASERIFNSPAHPFTRQLIAALPTLPSAQADKQQRTSFESMVLQ
ncbi:MAG: ABC transporter ATP-binding protein [Acidobacteria bacterium]|nr:ABC transporter ATP-binding protein [Acidobacteriota bacterium]